MTNPIESDSRFTCIVLDSYMDVGRAEELRAKFRNLVAGGCTHFVLDFQQTQFLCSATLGLLVEMYSSVKAHDGEVLLKNLASQVEKLLYDTKILSLFSSDIETDVNHPLFATFEAVQAHTNQELFFLSHINTIASDILMTDNVADIYRQILKAVVQSLKPRSAALLLLNDTGSGNVFHVAASDNLSPSILVQLEGMPLLEDSLEANCIASCQDVMFLSHRRNTSPVSPLLDATEMQEGLLEPIRGRSIPFGLILLESPESPSTYFAQCIPILNVFAKMCGMALEKQRFLEDIHVKNSELAKTLDALNRMQDTILESGKLAVVGALTRGLCHALNNKLVPILGYAQILGIGLDPESPEADKMRIIETAAFDIKKILDNMHMLATGVSMPFSNCDVGEIIDSCLQMQDYLFRENTIVVERDYGQVDPTVQVHRERLVQAFLALFHRLARMFQAFPGEHRVHIALERTAEYLLVIVKDNGRILSPEQLLQLEKPFDNGNPFENERLNFSIARSVIKDHQGMLEVDSSIEIGGTCVTMRFPVTHPHS
ncbi:TPA: hypothetical protein DDW35_11485 [Candidatus Sumerlaeota bacterium]|jgi:anti-anti-sigma factor|nr:hypothetical protein [Candidatus Sumerlaeota bacterium]